MIDELLEPGGAECNLIRTLMHLPKDRFRPFVLTFRFNNSAPAFAALPCPLEVFPIRGLLSWNSLRYAPQLVSFIGRNNIKIVHCFFETSDLWAAPLAKLSGAKVISSRRDMAIHRNSRLNLLYRLVGWTFDEIQAVSDQVGELFIRLDNLDPGRVCTIPNSFDLTSVPEVDPAAERQRWHLPAGQPLVTTVANIRPVKGIDVLVETAAIVHERMPDVVFAIAGKVIDHQHQRDLDAAIEAKGLTGTVRFIGQLQGSDPIRLMAASDLFFLPSRSEGMSNSLLEAMACRLPAVVTDTGGNPQLINHGESGLLVPVGDAAAAAAAIESALSDPVLAKRLGDAAYSRVASQFSSSLIADRLTGSYQRLIDQTQS